MGGDGCFGRRRDGKWVVGEVARGGLYEVEAAAGGWVTERWAATSGGPRLFYFYIFQKKFLQKYIFSFRFYSSIPISPGRGRQVLVSDFTVLYPYRPAGGGRAGR